MGSKKEEETRFMAYFIEVIYWMVKFLLHPLILLICVSAGSLAYLYMKYRDLEGRNKRLLTANRILSEHNHHFKEILEDPEKVLKRYAHLRKLERIGMEERGFEESAEAQREESTGPGDPFREFCEDSLEEVLSSLDESDEEPPYLPSA